MRINWKLARASGVLVALAFGLGCSGINTSQSVSPASFLIPGLLQVPVRPNHPGLENPEQTVATALALAR